MWKRGLRSKGRTWCGCVKLFRSSFAQDRMRYSAVIREFEIIGEAVGKLSEELKGGYPEIHAVQKIVSEIK